MFVAVSEIPAMFMLSEKNPNAESYGCVTVILVGHDKEMIHEKIKIICNS